MATSSPALPPKGLPILSGPPPIIESGVCRQCAKTFNPLWRRAHACGHCGYEYCSTCLSDGQALMPRRAGSTAPTGTFNAIKEELGIGSSKNVEGGYEVESVCVPCLSMLQVTAAKSETLRSLPLKRLKDYLAAYNISCVGPKEKEDFVQAVLKARDPATGCLSPEAESYYRRHSVPKSANADGASGNSSHNQARPPPRASSSMPKGNASAQAQPQPPNPPRSGQYAPRPQARPPPPQPRPPPTQSYRPTPKPTYRPAQPTYRPSPASSPARPPPPPKPRTPEPPVPTILSLVSLPKSFLNSLSIGTLKAILYENHVRLDFKQVLEKQELINRVNELITDERKRLERQKIEEERQAAEERGETAVAKEATSEEGGEEGEAADDEAIRKKKQVPTGPMAEVERGLCVVCQDEEATLAVVDCGHLAMCARGICPYRRRGTLTADCSDLVMATSKECPLCRTRIVTPQRLIRIYRV